QRLVMAKAAVPPSMSPHQAATAVTGTPSSAPASVITGPDGTGSKMSAASTPTSAVMIHAVGGGESCQAANHRSSGPLQAAAVSSGTPNTIATTRTNRRSECMAPAAGRAEVVDFGSDGSSFT